jgi:hypothetical protein
MPMQVESSAFVRLWDLRPNRCRWPLGGLWDRVEFFCGKPADGGCSYCREHRKRAFSRLACKAHDLRQVLPLASR